MPTSTIERGSQKPDQELGIISSIEHFLLPEAARMLETVKAEIPEVLEGFLPQELEFLSEASGLKGTISRFRELESKYGVDSRTLRRFYNGSMTRIWVETIGITAEQFSIDEILRRKGVSSRKKERRTPPQNTRRSEYFARRDEALKRWQDPVNRALAEAEVQKLHESYQVKRGKRARPRSIQLSFKL